MGVGTLAGGVCGGVRLVVGAPGGVGTGDGVTAA